MLNKWINTPKDGYSRLYNNWSTELYFFYLNDTVFSLKTFQSSLVANEKSDEIDLEHLRLSLTVKKTSLVNLEKQIMSYMWDIQKVLFFDTTKKYYLDAIFWY